MSDIRESMDKALESLKHNFSKVRTGRANANILSDITVDYYGVATPITQVAAVKVPEAHMLVIEPWDKALVNAIRQGGNRFGFGYHAQFRRHCGSSPVPRAYRGAPSRTRQGMPRARRARKDRPSVMHAAMRTTSSSVTRNSPRTRFAASRPKSRRPPMSSSPRWMRCSRPKKQRSWRSS